MEKKTAAPRARAPRSYNLMTIWLIAMIGGLALIGWGDSTNWWGLAGQ